MGTYSSNVIIIQFAELPCMISSVCASLFSRDSYRDGLWMYTAKWMPKGQPKGIIFIVHGASLFLSTSVLPCCASVSQSTCSDAAEQAEGCRLHRSRCIDYSGRMRIRSLD